MSSNFFGTWDFYLDKIRAANMVVAVTGATTVDVHFNVSSPPIFKGSTTDNRISFVEPLGNNKFRYYEGELVLLEPGSGTDPLRRGVLKGRFAVLNVTVAPPIVEASGDWTGTRPPIT